MLEISKNFSIPSEIFSVLTHELKLASYDELQSVYDMSDLFDLLEIQEAHDTMAAVARRKAEAQRQQK